MDVSNILYELNLVSVTSIQQKHISGTRKIEVVLPYFELAALFRFLTERRQHF